MAQLPSLDDVASQIKGSTPRETASPEINVNAATPTNKEEVASHDSPKEEAPKKDFLAPKFAALARREKEARARQEQAERVSQENQRLRQEIEQRAKAIEDREATIKAAKRPSEVLKAHGLSYADVTQDMLGSYEAPEADPVDVKMSERLTPIESENRALKEQLQQMQSVLSEIQTERAQYHQQQVRQDILRVATEAGHDLIGRVGDEAYTLVQLVQQDFQQKHGRPLSLKEACDKVEAYYEKAVLGLAESPKIKSRLAPAAPTPVPVKQSLKKEAAERPTTLTQSLSQGTRASKPDIDKLPKHEALAYLASQLRYKD